MMGDINIKKNTKQRIEKESDYRESDRECGT